MATIKIPKNVKWLLDFANLDCKLGELNLQRQIRYYTGLKLKEPPIESSDQVLRVLSSKLQPGLTIKKPPIEPSEIKKDIPPSILPLVKLVGNVTKRDCEFHVTNDGKFVPTGKSDFYPSIEDFKSFFLESWTPLEKRTNDLYLRGDISSIIPEEAMDISIVKAISRKGCYMPFKRKEVYLFLKFIWSKSIYFIWYLLQEIEFDKNKQEINPYIVAPNGFVIDIKTPRDTVYDFYMANQKIVDFRKLSLDRNVNYDHDGSLPLAIFALLIDFKHNHEELRQYLQQCPCCGKFWIEEKTRKKYCCEKCEDRFNQSSRQSNRNAQKKSRKNLNKYEKVNVRNEIIKWLSKECKYTPKKAVTTYNDEECRSSRNVKSLANFKRTFGKRSGFVS